MMISLRLCIFTSKGDPMSNRSSAIPPPPPPELPPGGGVGRGGQSNASDDDDDDDDVEEEGGVKRSGDMAVGEEEKWSLCNGEDEEEDVVSVLSSLRLWVRGSTV